jgi:hypothetical protein
VPKIESTVGVYPIRILEHAMSIELELGRATNMFGPLSIDIKNRLRAYFAEPSEERWDTVSGICVGGHMTVWQAWLATDPTAPRTGPASRMPEGGGPSVRVSGWSRWPNRIEFHRALAHATRRIA